MKFIVTAVSAKAPTAIVGSEWEFTGPREHVVDTSDNVLFEGCTSEWQVEDRYEEFWNRLNDHWEASFPSYKEKVKVLSVKKA